MRSVGAWVTYSRLFVLGAAVSVGSCTIVTSTLVNVHSNQTCSSTLGSYFLPRAYMNVTIERSEVGGPNVLGAVKEVRRVDNDHLYCINHVASAFSDDEIVIQKDRDVGEKPSTDVARNQFLGLVTSKAVDQSSIIIRKLVRILFVGIAQTGNILRSRRPESYGAPDKVTVEFDPLDQLSLGRANEAMRRFGFCMIVEEFTYNSKSADAQAYCNSPSRIAKIPTPFHVVYTKEVLESPKITTPGIYYRPRAPYRLATYTNAEPDISSKWRHVRTDIVHLENISPLIRLRIDRSAFAARRLAFVFEDGTLVGSCLFKGSEVAGALSIPLEVAKAIVSLPTVMFQVKIDEFTRSKDLIEAEQQLILTQKAYIDFLNAKEGSSAPTGKLGDASNTVENKLNPVPVPDKERLDAPPMFSDSAVWPAAVGNLCKNDASL